MMVESFSALAVPPSLFSDGEFAMMVASDVPESLVMFAISAVWPQELRPTRENAAETTKEVGELVCHVRKVFFRET